MSHEEYIIQTNLDYIKYAFICATILLSIAFVHVIKPTLSLSYQLNSKASFINAKLIAKFITAAGLYVLGIYSYFFTDLTQKTWHGMWPAWVILYHLLRWGLTKLFDLREPS